MTARTFYQLCLLQGGALALGFWAHHQFAADVLRQNSSAGHAATWIPTLAGVVTFLGTWCLTCGILGLVLLRSMKQTALRESLFRAEQIASASPERDREKQQQLSGAELIARMPESAHGLRLWDDEASPQQRVPSPTVNMSRPRLQIHGEGGCSGRHLSLAGRSSDSR